MLIGFASSPLPLSSATEERGFFLCCFPRVGPPGNGSRSLPWAGMGHRFQGASSVVNRRRQPTFAKSATAVKEALWRSGKHYGGQA